MTQQVTVTVENGEELNDMVITKLFDVEHRVGLARYRWACNGKTGEVWGWDSRPLTLISTCFRQAASQQVEQ